MSAALCRPGGSQTAWILVACPPRDRSLRVRAPVRPLPRGASGSRFVNILMLVQIGQHPSPDVKHAAMMSSINTVYVAIELSNTLKLVGMHTFGGERRRCIV